MSQITTDILVTNILNGMVGCLDDKQYKQLKNVLYIQFHDVDVSNKSYEVSIPIQQDNDLILEYFENSLRVARKSDLTVMQYIRTAKCLQAFIGKNFTDIDSWDIKKYIAYHQKTRHWKDSYASTQIRYISALYNFMLKEDIIEKNPMIKVDSVKREEIIKKPFSRMEIESIRNTCCNTEREIAMVELLLSSGIRVDELIKLNWNDLDYSTLSFIVYGKGAKERTVLFNERASFYLQKYFKYRMKKEGRTAEEMMQRPLLVRARRDTKTKDYERITDDGVRITLNKISELSGVEDIHPHKFRRTFATECYRKGMAVSEIQKLMGHNQIETTMLYITFDMTEVDHSYRKICT